MLGSYIFQLKHLNMKRGKSYSLFENGFACLLNHASHVFESASLLPLVVHVGIHGWQE